MTILPFNATLEVGIDDIYIYIYYKVLLFNFILCSDLFANHPIPEHSGGGGERVYDTVSLSTYLFVVVIRLPLSPSSYS